MRAERFGELLTQKDEKRPQEKKEKEKKEHRPERKLRQEQPIESAEPEKAERREMPPYWRVGAFVHTAGDSPLTFVPPKDENQVLQIEEYLPSGYKAEVRRMDRGESHPSGFISRRGDLIVIGREYRTSPQLANKAGYKAGGTTGGQVIEGVMFKEDDYYDLIYELNESGRIDEVCEKVNQAIVFLESLESLRPKGKDWGNYVLLGSRDFNPYKWVESAKIALEKGPFKIPESVPPLEIPVDVEFKNLIDQFSIDIIKKIGTGMRRIDRFKARKDIASAKSSLKKFIKESVPAIEEIKQQVVEVYENNRKTLGTVHDSKIISHFEKLEKLLSDLVKIQEKLCTVSTIKDFSRNEWALIRAIRDSKEVIEEFFQFANDTSGHVRYKLRDK